MAAVLRHDDGKALRRRPVPVAQAARARAKQAATISTTFTTARTYMYELNPKQRNLYSNYLTLALYIWPFVFCQMCVADEDETQKQTMVKARLQK